SVERLIHPVAIAFDEAIPLAALGLAVNLVSAWLLHDDGEHDGAPSHAHVHHDRDQQHDHHHHADHNSRADYVHVIADAAVSVLALVGLVTARALGCLWMDPVMGLVGMAVIANWSWNLIRIAGSVLLDMQPAGGLGWQIKQR